MRTHPANRASRFIAVVLTVWLFACLCALPGCGSSEEASGASFTPATSIATAEFHKSAARGSNGAQIDTSAVANGYVAAAASSSSRLKFQVTCNGQSTNYDLPQNGTPIVCPLTYGNGSYTFRVMQNTSGNNYVELYSTSAQVALASEFDPYLRPNVFCNYTEGSACVAKARELTANATNQGEAVKAIAPTWLRTSRTTTTKPRSLKEHRAMCPTPTARWQAAPASASTTQAWAQPCCAAKASLRKSLPDTFHPTTSTTPGSWCTSTAPGKARSPAWTPTPGAALTSPSPPATATRMWATERATPTATPIKALKHPSQKCDKATRKAAVFGANRPAIAANRINRL